MKNQYLLSLAAIAAIAASPLAQDSVSKTGGLPGDAVDPWSDANAANGSEQRNDYVVDLTPLKTSWSSSFGIAPIVKSSKASSTFFTSGISAQAISRTHLRNRPFINPTGYRVWNKAGDGINNDSQLNGQGSILPGGTLGNQFALGFAEFATTDKQASHGGVISAIVNYDPTEPSRLYVKRYVAALSGCDAGSQLSSFGFGAIDAAGNAIFRADGFGVSGTNCGGSLTSIAQNNIYMVDSASRDATKLNVINGTFPTGFDATSWILRSDGTTHGTPTIADVNGPFYIGPNFNDEYVRAPSTSTAPTKSSNHFASGITSQRGAMSYLSKNHPAFNSVNGLVGFLGSRGGTMDSLNVFGLDANGDPSKALALTVPATVTDPITKETNIPGNNEFDHYHSQVAFRGGTGQVAMNLDGQGNLLATAIMDHPSDGGSTWGQHFIPVARMDPSGNVTWTNAAYNSSPNNKAKEILDGPGGKAIGQLTQMSNVSSTIQGPSFSSPMIDAGGNVWFVSAIEIYGTTSTFTVGLIRAVYDAAQFGYELELVLKSGDVIQGANSQTEYLIDFIPLADSNSIDSSAAFSQNISETGAGGFDHPLAARGSSLHLGGLVLNARILYDNNGDKNFDRSTGANGNPNSPDEDYNVMLFIGSLEDVQIDQGSSGPGNSELSIAGEGLAQGENSSLTLSKAPASQPSVLLWSFPNGVTLPFAGGNVLSFTNLFLVTPTVTSAQGDVSLPLTGQPILANVLYQMVTLDPAAAQGWSISNGVLARFGR
jgi:hypothetical protein